MISEMMSLKLIMFRFSRPMVVNLNAICHRRCGFSTTSSFFSSGQSSPPSSVDVSTVPDVLHFRVSPSEHPLYKKPDRFKTRPSKDILETEASFKTHVWSKDELEAVKVVSKEPSDTIERIAFLGVKTLRFGFDILSGYSFGKITDKKFLRRAVFLETVAGIPGMVAASLRHLRSLRLLKRDNGWITTLLEESENERMHALIFSGIRKNGLLFRGAIMVAQGIFWNVFFFSYLASPRLCHAFVSFLEEEAVKTYSSAIEAYDRGDLPRLQNMDPPKLAKEYWRLPDGSTMRDVLEVVRADEANHRDVNHVLSKLDEGAQNPTLNQYEQ